MKYAACVFSFLIGFLYPLDSFSQAGQYATLSGTVTDSEPGEALIGAHVFIAVSLKGSITDDRGRFLLDSVLLGAHRLYVSMLGYEPESRDILLREPRAHTFTFELIRTILEIGEVTVTAERDDRWLGRLEKFVSLFIGETPNAALTEIVNPEVLDFEDKIGLFTARAAETLVIENKALGYRIQYFLKEFKSNPTRVWYYGEPLFEEMKPENPEQQVRWRTNREKAYYGSFRHFILAVQAGRMEQEGFKAYHRPAAQPAQAVGGAPIGQNMLQGRQRFPIKEKDIISDGELETEKVLDFPGYVEFVYMGEMEDESYIQWQQRSGRPKYQTSMLMLEGGPTIVDYKGDTLDPYGVTFFGYLAFERVADELPKEYRPAR